VKNLQVLLQPEGAAHGMIGAEVIVPRTVPCIRAALAGRWLGDE
jgi:hypothetical protein